MQECRVDKEVGCHARDRIWWSFGHCVYRTEVNKYNCLVLVMGIISDMDTVSDCFALSGISFHRGNRK